MARFDDGAGRAILLVEDEPFIRLDLVDFFEDAGFVVYEAENADEAIALLARTPIINIMLTDVHMPGSMDGVRLAHYVRERHPPTLLIVASGVAKPTQADLPAGALFFSKPFNPRFVLNAINAAA